MCTWEACQEAEEDEEGEEEPEEEAPGLEEAEEEAKTKGKHPPRASQTTKQKRKSRTA